MPKRAVWLMERRRLAEQRYDTMFAPVYDDQWGATIDPTHQMVLEQFLTLCPPAPAILDAACGTGKYWPILLAQGAKVTGIDQSKEMLDRALSKYPGVRGAQIGLQEARYLAAASYDGVICIDAMEFVFPEDWPLVLANFRRALRQGGLLYLTVELEDQERLQAAYRIGKKKGYPLVPGESVVEGGYHYYPADYQVGTWLDEAGFMTLEVCEGGGYAHYLCRVGG